MSKLPLLIPISDLRQDTASIIKQAKSSTEPIIITQRGRAAAVLLSPEQFHDLDRKRELLALLALGEADVRANRGVELDELLVEAKELLHRPPK